MPNKERAAWRSFTSSSTVALKNGRSFVLALDWRAKKGRWGSEWQGRGRVGDRENSGMR